MAMWKNKRQHNTFTRLRLGFSEVLSRLAQNGVSAQQDTVSAFALVLKVLRLETPNLIGSANPDRCYHLLWLIRLLPGWSWMQHCREFAEITKIHSLMPHSFHIVQNVNVSGKYTSGRLQAELFGFSDSYNISYFEKRTIEVQTKWSWNVGKAISCRHTDSRHQHIQ